MLVAAVVTVLVISMVKYCGDCANKEPACSRSSKRGEGTSTVSTATHFVTAPIVAANRDIMVTRKVKAENLTI